MDMQTQGIISEINTNSFVKCSFILAITDLINVCRLKLYQEYEAIFCNRMNSPSAHFSTKKADIEFNFVRVPIMI